MKYDKRNTVYANYYVKLITIAIISKVKVREKSVYYKTKIFSDKIKTCVIDVVVIVNLHINKRKNITTVRESVSTTLFPRETKSSGIMEDFLPSELTPPLRN